MATEFTHTIAMLVPEPLWQQAGDLIALISNNKNDRMQFGNAKFSGGYDACNNPAKESHVQALMAAHAGIFVPPRPDFDVLQELDIPALVQLVKDAQIITELTDNMVLPQGKLVLAIDFDVLTIAAVCNLLPVAVE